MKIESISPDETVLVRLSKDELIILNNVLNEICHGVKMLDFSPRIGATLEETKRILQQIHELLETIDALNPTSEKPKIIVHKQPSQENFARPRRVR